MTSNQANKIKVVNFDSWLNSKKGLREGFISVYDNAEFNSEGSSSYEVGRQIAIIAKANGYKTKGILLRKKPKSDDYAWVKTRYRDIESLVRSLGFDTRKLLIKD